jgi:hypothetical protein
MKKTALFLLACILLFAGCSSSQSLQEGESLTSSENLTTPKPKEYVITHSACENWDQFQPSDFLQNDLVPTEKNAIAVANAIVQSAVGEQEWKKHYLSNVWEDIEREVWVITYVPRSEDASYIIVGGDITIVIRKHDAQVVKMWAGE